MVMVVVVSIDFGSTIFWPRWRVFLLLRLPTGLTLLGQLQESGKILFGPSHSTPILHTPILVAPWHTCLLLLVLEGCFGVGVGFQVPSSTLITWLPGFTRTFPFRPVSLCSHLLAPPDSAAVPPSSAFLAKIQVQHLQLPFSRNHKMNCQTIITNYIYFSRNHSKMLNHIRQHTNFPNAGIIKQSTQEKPFSFDREQIILKLFFPQMDLTMQ